MLFGEDQNLNILQMSCRGIAVFVITLLLIRLSGRRSYSFRMPLDNIIGILLGGILSRAVVGASPFLPIVFTCFVIVILHRAFSWLTTHYKFFNELIEGSKIILFQNGNFIDVNMKKALVSREDIMQNIRKSAFTEDLSSIDIIYIERNGDISAVKKVIIK